MFSDQIDFSSLVGQTEVAPSSSIELSPLPDDVTIASIPKDAEVQPAPAPEPTLYVFIESFSAVSCDDPSVSTFDVVLNVSSSCGYGETPKSCKVVKRVSFSNESLKTELEARANAQTTVVESVEKQTAQKADLLKLMRELSGVGGKGTFV